MTPWLLGCVWTIASSSARSPATRVVSARVSRSSEPLRSGASGHPSTPAGRLVGDVRAARTEILERVDGVEWAELLLVDDSSLPLVPTGELSVRFHEPLSDDELAGFAKEHGLELRRRNEFVPEQAVFAPQRWRGELLTERAEKLSHERAVSEAWLNTASEYHRA